MILGGSGHGATCTHAKLVRRACGVGHSLMLRVDAFHEQTPGCRLSLLLYTHQPAAETQTRCVPSPNALDGLWRHLLRGLLRCLGLLRRLGLLRCRLLRRLLRRRGLLCGLLRRRLRLRLLRGGRLLERLAELERALVLDELSGGDEALQLLVCCVAWELATSVSARAGGRAGRCTRGRGGGWCVVVCFLAVNAHADMHAPALGRGSGTHSEPCGSCPGACSWRRGTS